MTDQDKGLPSEVEKLLLTKEVDKERLALALAGEHWAQVYRLALSLLDDPEAARRTAVETFAAALSGSQQYQPRQGVQAWLYSIVTQTIHNLPREKSALQKAGPEEEITAFSRAIQKMTQSLGWRERSVLVLTYVLDWKAAQIAPMLHVSEQAVQAQIEIFRQEFWKTLGGPGRADEKQVRQLESQVAASLKKRWPAPQITESELETLAKEIIERAGARGPVTRRRVLAGWPTIAGLVLLVVVVLAIAAVAVWPILRRQAGTTGPGTPLAGMPTPVTPPPQAQPLTRRSSSDEIHRRMIESNTLWNTLWIDIQTVDYGPTSYLGQAKAYRDQTWISQDENSVELFGLLSNRPNQAHLVTKGKSLIINPLTRQASVGVWDGDAEDMLENRTLRWMVFPYSSPWAEQEGVFDVQGSESVAGRKAILADWLNPQGQVEAHLWLDTATGVILRAQQFGGEEWKSLLWEAQATEVRYDLNAPPDRMAEAILLENASGEPGSEVVLPEFTVLLPTPTLAMETTRRVAPPGEPAPPSFDAGASVLKFHLPGQTGIVETRENTAQVPIEFLADGYSLGMVSFGLPWVLRCDRSSDGQRLAFNTGTDGTTIPDDALRWLNLSEPQAIYQPLPGLHASEFAFAPDSRRIAAFGQGDGDMTSGLYLVDIGTGEYRLVIPLATGRSLVWGPDGEHLALIGQQEKGTPEEAMVVHVDTGVIVNRLPASELEEQAPPEWPVPGWGVEFPVEMGGMDACAERPN